MAVIDDDAEVKGSPFDVAMLLLLSSLSLSLLVS